MIEPLLSLYLVGMWCMLLFIPAPNLGALFDTVKDTDEKKYLELCRFMKNCSKFCFWPIYVSIYVSWIILRPSTSLLVGATRHQIKLIMNRHPNQKNIADKGNLSLAE